MHFPKYPDRQSQCPDLSHHSLQLLLTKIDRMNTNISNSFALEGVTFLYKTYQIEWTVQLEKGCVHYLNVLALNSLGDLFQIGKK